MPPPTVMCTVVVAFLAVFPQPSRAHGWHRRRRDRDGRRQAHRDIERAHALEVEAGMEIFEEEEEEEGLVQLPSLVVAVSGTEPPYPPCRYMLAPTGSIFSPNCPIAHIENTQFGLYLMGMRGFAAIDGMGGKKISMEAPIELDCSEDESEQCCRRWTCSTPSSLSGSMFTVCKPDESAGDCVVVDMCGTKKHMDEIVQEWAKRVDEAVRDPSQCYAKKWNGVNTDVFDCTGAYNVGGKGVNIQTSTPELKDPYVSQMALGQNHDFHEVPVQFELSSVFNEAALAKLRGLNADATTCPVTRTNVMALRSDDRSPLVIFKDGFYPYYLKADEAGLCKVGTDMVRFGEMPAERVLGGDADDSISCVDVGSVLYIHKAAFRSCWFVSAGATPCVWKAFQPAAWIYLVVADHVIDATGVRRVARCEDPLGCEPVDCTETELGAPCPACSATRNIEHACQALGEADGICVMKGADGCCVDPHEVRDRELEFFLVGGGPDNHGVRGDRVLAARRSTPQAGYTDTQVFVNWDFFVFEDSPHLREDVSFLNKHLVLLEISLPVGSG